MKAIVITIFFSFAIFTVLAGLLPRRKWFHCKICNWYFSDAGDEQIQKPDSETILEGICENCSQPKP